MQGNCQDPLDAVRTLLDGLGFDTFAVRVGCQVADPRAFTRSQIAAHVDATRHRVGGAVDSLRWRLGASPGPYSLPRQILLCVLGRSVLGRPPRAGKPPDGTDLVRAGHQEVIAFVDALELPDPERQALHGFLDPDVGTCLATGTRLQRSRTGICDSRRRLRAMFRATGRGQLVPVVLWRAIHNFDQPR